MVTVNDANGGKSNYAAATFTKIVGKPTNQPKTILKRSPFTHYSHNANYAAFTIPTNGLKSV